MTATPTSFAAAECTDVSSASPIDDADAAAAASAEMGDLAVETGEDALTLIESSASAAAAQSEGDGEEEVQPTAFGGGGGGGGEAPNADDADETTSAANETTSAAKEQRRASHTWKGFKFKKQLSKVDLKIKNTFSHPAEKAARKNESTAAADDDEGGSDVAAAVPRIREPSSASAASGVAQTVSSRPTDLNLFDEPHARDEKPARPERRKERKRFSLEKQAPRDARLLSVPNIKYQNLLKDSKKSKPSNNQAFFSLIRRLSKFLGFSFHLFRFVSFYTYEYAHIYTCSI